MRALPAARPILAVLAVGTATAGQLLLASHHDAPALACWGAAAVLAFFLPAASDPPPAQGLPSRRVTLLSLLATTALTAATRLYRFYDVPPGLWADELDITRLARGVLDGKPHRPWEVVPHLEISYAYVYFQAFFLKVLGPGYAAVRLPGTLGGILVAPVLYLLARRLLGHGVGLLVSALWAVSFWPLNMGRWGHGNSWVPFFFCSVLLLTWKALESRRLLLWLAAGAVFGVSLHSYQANRAILFLVVALVARHVVISGTRVRSALAGLALFVLGAAPFAGPLAAGYRSNPQALERTWAVSIFNRTYTPDPAAGIRGNVVKYLSVFHRGGDPNLRHAAGSGPALGPFLGVLATLGLVVAIRRPIRPAPFLALAWTGLFLAAGILTTEAPNMFRIFGIVPGLLLLAGVAAGSLWTAVQPADPARSRLLGPLLASAALLAVAIPDLQLYFGWWARQDQTWAGFSAHETRARLFVSRLQGPWDIYSDFLDAPGDDLLSGGRPQTKLAVPDDLLPPAGSTAPTLWLVNRYDLPLAPYLARAFPRAESRVEKQPNGELLYGEVRLPAGEGRAGWTVTRHPGDAPLPEPSVDGEVGPLGPEAGAAVPSRVRWRGALRVASTGRYRLVLSSPNETRLYVNGEPVLESSPDGRAVTADVALPAGAIPVRLDRSIRTKPDLLQLRWSPLDAEPLAPPEPLPVVPARFPEGGLLMVGYEGPRIVGKPLAIRHDPLLIAVNYGGQACAGQRWVGTLEVPEAGAYGFKLIADDGARLFLDGAPALSWWVPDSGVVEAVVNLTAGRHAVRIDYLDLGGSRWFEIDWRPPRTDTWVRLPPEVLRWSTRDVEAAIRPFVPDPVSIASGDGPVPLTACRPQAGCPSGAGLSGDGQVLIPDRRISDQGFGVKSPAALDFDLGGRQRTLMGQVVTDAATFGDGKAVFRIRGDGRVLFETAGGPKPVSFEVPVTNVRTLTLEVEEPEGSPSDFADWIDLRLSR